MDCNGDSRLCPLRLDQVTLPGLHNAGAGFDQGFGFLNCWVRNHARSIQHQLELGIRHLDIDPCHDTCGFLGSCHSYFCGGSICSILKQTRRFLLQNPNEVVTLNFNHEVVEPTKVFRELTRHLRIQLGPLLSSRFRRSGLNPQWPTLRESILSNQRLVVFYAWIVQRHPHHSRYRRNKWIHTESWLGSTWDEIQVTQGCRELLSATERMCGVRQYREMVEVAAVPAASFGSCVTDIAEMCRPRLMEALQICQPFRYRHGKSPNVLLVDYPEVNPREVTSVFHAVYLQNVRNVLQHRPSQCRMTLNAAALVSESGIFFSGSSVVTYDFDKGMQVAIRSLPLELHQIDAAYMEQGQAFLIVVKDCHVWKVDQHSLRNVSQKHPLSDCNQEVNAAVVWRGLVHLFQGCFIVTLGSSRGPQRTEEWGLPCSVDAAMTSPDGAYVYVFKGGYYWKYDGNSGARFGSLTTVWNIDVVCCDGDN